MSGMETTVSYVSLFRRWSRQRDLYLAVVMTTVVEPLSALHIMRSELRRVSRASSSAGVRFFLVGFGLNCCMVVPISILNSINSIGMEFRGGVQFDRAKILEYWFLVLGWPKKNAWTCKLRRNLGSLSTQDVCGRVLVLGTNFKPRLKMSLAVSEMSMSPIIVTSVVFLDSLNISSAARFLSLFLFRRRFDFLAVFLESVGCGGGGK